MVAVKLVKLEITLEAIKFFAPISNLSGVCQIVAEDVLKLTAYPNIAKQSSGFRNFHLSWPFSHMVAVKWLKLEITIVAIKFFLKISNLSGVCQIVAEDVLKLTAYPNIPK